MLSALYYPFSRCIDVSSVKQMLLVFDSVHFLDPIDDEQWRAIQFRGLEEQEDKRFNRYEDVHHALPLLMQEGAIARVDPENLMYMQETSASAAAVSDLMDSKWVQIASDPAHFNLPHRNLADDGHPTWQIFLSKLPAPFINALREHRDFQKHLVYEGDAHASWTLSYEAGSAASMNVHLAAAEELQLAPVTDSRMHHELLLRKLIRESDYKEERSRPLSEDVVIQLAHETSISLVEEVLPRQALHGIGFDDILRFREQTRDLRTQFVADVSSRLFLLTRVPTPEDLHHATQEVKSAIRKELRTYQADMTGVRDKLWPNLVASLNKSLASGGVAAVAMNYIGGPGHALAASIVAGSLAILKSTLDIRAEKNKLQNSASPGVTYLSNLYDQQ